MSSSPRTGRPKSARHRSSRTTLRFDPCCVTFAKYVNARPGELLLIPNRALGMRFQRERIKGRPEPGAALRSAPVYDGAGPSDRTSRMTKLQHALTGVWPDS